MPSSRCPGKGLRMSDSESNRPTNNQPLNANLPRLSSSSDLIMTKQCQRNFNMYVRNKKSIQKNYEVCSICKKNKGNLRDGYKFYMLNITIHKAIIKIYCS